VQSTVQRSINQGMFQREYAQAFAGDENWRTMPVPTGSTFQWDEKSTYIEKPPYFEHMGTRRHRFRIWRGCACWRCWAIR
jgi:aconitate hydratase